MKSRLQERLELFHGRRKIRDAAPFHVVPIRLNRPDNPAGVMDHAGRYDGGTALIVLGGYSAEGWEDLRDQVCPDVILGGNGVNAVVRDLDYWMCAENMTTSHNMAERGDPRGIEFMEMFHRDAGAKVKLISHWSWKLLRDRSNCINIRRHQGFERGHVPARFSLREYGDGFMNGWVFKDKSAITVATRVGTVGTHLLHMAGILGVSVVHTIGFDMVQRSRHAHHWYKYPVYQVDRYRRQGMFIDYQGMRTQKLWMETAEFLRSMQNTFKRDGLAWTDHSDGLLKMEGVWCAK